MGLIITRALIVLPIGLKLKLYEHPNIFEPLRKLTTEIHKYNCKIFLQLSGGAGRTLHKTVNQMEEKGIGRDEAFFAPSDGIPNVWYPEIIHRGLSKEEICEYIHAFAAMAEIAKNLGFDGIEIHAIHEGYLLDQFTISNTNHRTDEYGGCLENRFRIVCDIVKCVKAKCGKGYPVSVRYSVTSKMKDFNNGALPSEKYVEFGRDISEGIEGAKLLESAGVDMLDCDNGSYDSWYWAHPPVYMPNCCNLHESEIVKNNVTIPVVCAGKMDLPNDALEALLTKKCDAIGVARALLVDPEYVNKIQHGCVEEIKPCVGCHTCLANAAEGKNLTCALNPKVLKEKFFENILPKKFGVTIIGAGIAGLEAAILLKRCGVDVTVYEMSDKIGGNFNKAAMFSYKEREKLLLEWYSNEVDKLGINIRFNTKIVDANLESLKDNIIIIAEGVMPKKLIYSQYKSIRVEDYLEDHNCIKDSVVIVGGGLTAIESAIEMANEGHEVIVIEVKEQILPGVNICEANKQFLLQSIKAKKIKIYTSSQLIDATENNIAILTKNDRKNISLKNYTIVEATGYMNSEGLAKQKIIGKDIYVIGDAKCVGNVQKAVLSAYNAVISILKA